METPDEALLLLQASDFVLQHDLRPELANVVPKTLVLREYRDDIEPSLEFRCFVAGQS